MTDKIDATTERRAVAMAVADGVDPVAWEPRAKFARRYLRMARAAAASDKAARLKLMPEPEHYKYAWDNWRAAPWLPGEEG